MLMLNKLTANYYHAFQTLFPSKNVISFEIIILIIFLTSLQLFKTFKVSMHNSKLRCWKYYINFMAKLIQLKPLHSTNKRISVLYACLQIGLHLQEQEKFFFGTTWRLIFSRLIFMIIFICFSRFASHSLFLTPKRGPDRCQSDFWNCFTSQKTLEDCSQSIEEVEHLVESRVTRQKLYIIQSCSRTHLSFFWKIQTDIQSIRSSWWQCFTYLRSHKPFQNMHTAIAKWIEYRDNVLSKTVN